MTDRSNLDAAIIDTLQKRIAELEADERQVYDEKMARRDDRIAELEEAIAFHNNLGETRLQRIAELEATVEKRTKAGLLDIIDRDNTIAELKQEIREYKATLECWEDGTAIKLIEQGHELQIEQYQRLLRWLRHKDRVTALSATACEWIDDVLADDVQVALTRLADLDEWGDEIPTDDVTGDEVSRP